MRYVCLGILTLIIFGCSNIKDKDFSLEKESYERNTKSVNDNIILYVEGEDTFSFSNNELKQIIKLFPALDTSWITDPDISYNKSVPNGRPNSKKFIDSNNEKNKISFESELGKDEYYILYSFFLKKKNGDKKYNAERETLIKLYRDINGIFEGLMYGGTAFGHMHRRTIGYAEYSVYLYSHVDTLDEFYSKKYDISKQKQLYINSLKQLINDEESVDNWTLDKKGKLERQKEFLERVSDIEKLITNYFYLKRAQEFQYEHY